MKWNKIKSRRHRNNIPEKFLVLFMFWLMTACSSPLGLGGDDTPDLIYDLALPQTTGTINIEADTILLLEPITYPAFIDTQKIAVKPTQQEIRYLANARWQDKGPDLISRYLLISLEQLRDIHVINRDDALRVYQFRLDVDVRDFSAHIEKDGMPVTYVVFVAELTAASSLKMVTRESFSRKVKATANSKDAIVSAFNSAIEEITTDMIDWIEAKAK